MGGEGRPADPLAAVVSNVLTRRIEFDSILSVQSRIEGEFARCSSFVCAVHTLQIPVLNLLRLQ